MELDKFISYLAENNLLIGWYDSFTKGNIRVALSIYKKSNERYIGANPIIVKTTEIELLEESKNFMKKC